MHRDRGNRNRYRLTTVTKVGENRVARDGYTVGVESLPHSVSVVRERNESYGAGLERRTDNSFGCDFLGQADTGTHQKALRLAQLIAVFAIQVCNDQPKEDCRKTDSYKVVLRLHIIHAALNSRRLSRFPEKFGLVRTLLNSLRFGRLHRN